MNEQVMDTQSDKEYQSGRSGAMIFAGIVYTGVVFAATTLFINFILTAFPNNAFGSRAIMAIAGVLVGCSMLAFPIALHKWAVSGWHRYTTIGLYFLEMAIVALNSVVSFAALLYKHTGAAMPEWVAWYEPFSIVSIVYTLAAWGTIFLMDPQIKRKAHDRASKERFYDKVQDKLDDFLDSVEGEEAVERVAVSKIQEKFHPDLSKRRHWGDGKLGENTTPQSPAPARLPQVSARPALPARQDYTAYTAQDLCDLWRMTRAQLAETLGSYGSVSDAFEDCQTNGFVPKDMTRSNFLDIWIDVFPNPQPLRIPRPVSQDNNGRNFR
jgi:hypothetical protein